MCVWRECTAHMRRDRKNDRENNSKSKRHAPKPVWSPANALFIEAIYVLSSVSALAWARDSLEFAGSPRVETSQPRVERAGRRRSLQFSPPKWARAAKECSAITSLNQLVSSALTARKWEIFRTNMYRLAYLHPAASRCAWKHSGKRPVASCP